MARRTGPPVHPTPPNRARAADGPVDSSAPTVGSAPETAPHRFDFNYGQDQSPSGGEPEVFGEDRIGDPTVTAGELARMGNLVATRHLLTLLAMRRSKVSRDEVVQEVADLLLALDDGPAARRLLLQMAEVGRIVDIYPLEVMVRMMERDPTAMPKTRFAPVILNAVQVEGVRWSVGEVIPLKVPLNLRLKGFALEGGGTPGYALAPGPPARYELEIGAAGTFRLLFRGDVRREARVHRVVVEVRDTPLG